MSYDTALFRSTQAGTVTGEPYWVAVDHVGERVEQRREFSIGHLSSA